MRETPRAVAANPARGIALKIVSTLVFTTMSVCVKLVADRIPPGEIVFARSFFALIPVIGMLLWQGHLFNSLRTSKPWSHVGRGAIGIASMACGFTALGFLPLPEAMMIGYAAPLMVVALSAIMLGEVVRVYRWSATTVGFFGVIIILWPRLSVFSGGGLGNGAALGAAIALAGALFTAFASIFVRSMTRTEGTGSIVVYFSLIGAVLALLSLPFGWVLPDLHDAILLLAVGLLGGVGQLLMTTAYRHADAATVTSFEYVSMLWGVSFGYLVFAEIPGKSVIAGGAIVIAAGLFIIYRERQLGIERRRERKAVRPSPV